MLGLYNYIANSKAVQSIVRGGLQLFYKADRTQAPLGEEQVRNNSFDELGSEEVDNGDFATDLSNWTIERSDSTHTVTHTSNGARFKSDTTHPLLTFTSDTANIVSGKSYQIKVVISEYQGSSGIKIQSSATGDVKYLFDSVDTFTYNFTAVSSSSTPIQFYRDTADVDITIKSVSLKEVDPNDNWGDTADRTWTIEDGKLSHVQGTGDDNQCRQTNVIQAGKKYQVNYSIVDYTSGSVRVDLGDANPGTARSAVGDYSEIIINTGTNTFVDIEPVTGGSGTFIGAVSNISVREVTNSIKDHSTNSNDGILYSGKALDFDGTGDSVTVGDTGIDMKTVAFWIFVADVTSNTEQIMEFKTDHGISSVNGTITTAGTFTNKVIYVNGSAGSSISASDWSRIVITTTAAIDVNQLVFGTDGSSSGTFAIADFQLYDKAWNYTDVKYDWENPDKDVFDRVDEAQILGEEEVIDGGFPTGTTAWELIYGATISGNKANIIGDGTTFTNIKQTGVFENGKVYQVVIDVTINSGLGLKFQDGATNENIGFATTTGIYTFNFTGASNADLVIGRRTSDTAFNSNVNSISVKEITTHASHILPTDCKSLLRLNEGAGDRVYDAAPVLGAEKVVNGDFALDSDWTEGAGWDIDVVNNKATCDGSQTGNSNLSQVVYTPGKVHKTIITVDSVDAGSISIFTGTSNSQLTITEAGTYTIIAKVSAGSDTIYIQANALFEGSISNVSVKEIKPAESFAIVGDKNFIHQQPYIPQYAMSSFSKKMVFTDVDTDVDVGAQSIADNQAFSFSFWYAHQASDSTVENYILAKHDSTDDYIRINNQNEALELKVNGSSLAYNIGDLNNFKTSHIVLTRASGSNPITKCYVNSTLEVTDTSSNTGGVFEYQQIGAGGTSNAGTFFLDELAHFNKELSLTEVQEIFNSGTALDCRDHSSVSNLEGYWRNNGADTWTDLSTNSNNGTVNGSPTEIFLQEVPFFGRDSLGMFMNKPRLGGLNFAKNGWVEVRDNVSLDVASTNAISVCCWYKANSAASYDAAQYLINSETYSNAGGWTLIAGTSQIVWTAEVGSNASIGYNHNDRLDWQYIVATYDEQNYRLFTFDENGNISVTTPVASTSALVDEYPINIGGFNEGSGSLINGVIDDIKIYNKALTQAEIKKNYNATKGKHKN